MDIRNAIQSYHKRFKIMTTNPAISDETYDFTEVESQIGFTIHPSVKEFYRCFFNERIEGTVYSHQIPTTCTWGHWFEFNHSFELFVRLKSVRPNQNLHDFILRNTKEWTGGFDFGPRIMIGSVYTTVGDILLLVNNSNGKIEWFDSEYGNFGNLQEDPNGEFAPSLIDLISLLGKKNLIKKAKALVHNFSFISVLKKRFFED